jgi:hypothetical protein
MIRSRNAPTVSQSTVLENAQSGMIGSTRRAAMTTVRRRPIRCGIAPNVVSPMIAVNLVAACGGVQIYWD